MTLLNVGFSSYSFTKKMLSETCWGKNFVWKIFAPLVNGNAKTRFCTTEPRPEWKKSKLKINGMRMRNLLRSLSEAEISSSRRRSREKKKKTTWRHFGVESCDLSVNCILWEEKKPLVNTFLLPCSIDRKNPNGEILRRAFRHFHLNE